MGIGAFLTEIATGLASFLPAFGQALYETFFALFFETGEGGATQLNMLASISIAFFIIGLAFKVLPTVLSWLKAKSKGKGKKRRAR